MSAHKNQAVLIVNLGSPEKLTAGSVRRFLRKFLSDPRVVNLPYSIWWIILNFFILPFRPKKSKKAYAKIWTQRGSPLQYLTQDLVDKLSLSYQSEQHTTIYMAMSYSPPFLSTQLRHIKKNQYDKLLVLPLYPQYSSTTSASVFDAVMMGLKGMRYVPELHFINAYHQHPLYIKALAESIEKHWKQYGVAELLLMSFHGLPELLTKKGDPYYYQCLQTASLVSQYLGLSADKWRVVFQSRFGRAKWLQPYCIETLMALPDEGIHNVDIICPGFPVDCLETLEEINMANKALFLDAGGKQYRYIAALNDSDSHVALMRDLIKG